MMLDDNLVVLDSTKRDPEPRELFVGELAATLRDELEKKREEDPDYRMIG